MKNFNHQVDVALGTPPQNISLEIDISIISTLCLVPDCLFCPSDGMFDPSHSSTFQRSVSSSRLFTAQFRRSLFLKSQSERQGSWDLGGLVGNETLTLGGVLQDISSPMGKEGLNRRNIISLTFRVSLYRP